MDILTPRAIMASPATSAEWDKWQKDMLSEPSHLLTNLCEGFTAWLQPQPVHTELILALLLSAVTAGTSANQTSSSNRIQVMTCF